MKAWACIAYEDMVCVEFAETRGQARAQAMRTIRDAWPNFGPYTTTKLRVVRAPSLDGRDASMKPYEYVNQASIYEAGFPAACIDCDYSVRPGEGVVVGSVVRHARHRQVPA